jgi:hypothetical protein
MKSRRPLPRVLIRALTSPLQRKLAERLPQRDGTVQRNPDDASGVFVNFRT